MGRAGALCWNYGVSPISIGLNQEEQIMCKVKGFTLIETAAGDFGDCAITGDLRSRSAQGLLFS